MSTREKKTLKIIRVSYSSLDTISWGLAKFDIFNILKLKLGNLVKTFEIPYFL